MTEAFGLAARVVHIGALMAAFGGALFPFYARASGGMPRWALILALPSGLACAAATFALAVGGWNALADPALLLTITLHTGFGAAWLAHLAACALLVAASPWLGQRGALLLSAMALASLSGIGHSGMHEGTVGSVHRLVQAAHLLAGGAWLGGLAPLRRALREHPPAIAEQITARFSRIGYGAVFLALASGLASVWLVNGLTLPALHSSYAAALALKLTFFAILLALAARNRFRLSRPLAPAPLAQAIRIEQVVFVALLAAAAFLASRPPGG